MRTALRVGILVLGMLSLVMFLQVVAAQTAKESGATLPSSGRGEVVRGETGKTLDEYLTRLEKFGFSGAAIAAKNGEIILSKGYGWANREKRIPFMAETVSSIGSITDRKSTRLNSSHIQKSRMPSSA